MDNTYLNNTDKLLQYLRDMKKCQARTTQAILKILIKSGNTGITRCCLREELNQLGIDVGQPAAQIRDLRSAGVNIPKQSKKTKCSTHNKTDTVDKLQTPYITGNAYARANYTPQEVASIQTALGNVDAFTCVQSNQQLEIDHRVPVARLKSGSQTTENKVNVNNPTEITARYQPLTGENNLMKSRVCEKCVNTNHKPTHFLGISIPDEIGGGQEFVEGVNDCSSCPFAHPENFRAKLQYRD